MHVVDTELPSSYPSALFLYTLILCSCPCHYWYHKTVSVPPCMVESWTWLQQSISPAAGLDAAPLCEKEQEEHCQSPTK